LTSWVAFLVLGPAPGASPREAQLSGEEKPGTALQF
jgi:hypothetical protein